MWDAYASAGAAIFSFHNTDSNNPTAGAATTSLQAAWNRTKPTFAAPNTTVQSELLTMVEGTAEMVATRGRAQGQTVIEFLGQRPMPSRSASSLVGSVTHGRQWL